MFDRAAIFRKAWAGYREQVAAGNRARAARGEAPLRFSRKLFAAHLRMAWSHAKANAAYVAQCAAEANVPAEVQAIRSELLAMQMSDAPINWDRHRELHVSLFRASVELAA